MRPIVPAVLATLVLGAVASTAHAQLFASEPATVSQTVDGTRITVEYSRPRARGRTGLFGTRVHAGETWTPGANAATTLALSKDATIEGIDVPKGKYSVWIVTAPERWEMVLDRDTMLFHTMAPKRRPGQIRFPVQRETRPFMEVLTWWFPDVGSTGATLAMQWDTVRVALRVGVRPSFTRVVEAGAARRLEGRYRMRMEPMPQPPGGGDTTLVAPEEKPPTELTFTVRYEGNELRAVMDPPMYSTESGYRDWILIPSKSGWYKLGRFDGDELVEVVDWVALHFPEEGATAAGFEVRATNDMLVARGVRLP